MSDLAGSFKESDTRLGVFYPKNYILAAFPDLAAAQSAYHKLRLAGVAEDDAFTMSGDDLIELTKDESGGLGSFLMQGFSRFLATEQISTDQDLNRARHGAAFVAVYCPTERSKQDAWAVLEPEHPLAARYYDAGGIEHLAGDFVTN